MDAVSGRLKRNETLVKLTLNECGLPDKFGREVTF